MMIRSNYIIVGSEMDVISGFIKIKNGKIEEVGRGKPKKNVLNLEDYIIAPGLINAHTHIGDSLFKDRGIGLPIEEVVGKKGLKNRLLEETPENKILNGMKSTLHFLLSSGITTICDFREGGVKGAELLQRALKSLKIRGVILGRGMDVEKLLKIADGFGISSISNYDMESLHKIVKEVKEKNGLIGIHVCESRSGECERALSLEPDFLVHLTNASKKEITMVLKKKIGVVCCPRANCMLGVGFPPIEKLMGAHIALGTDNVMVNSPNMWREMEFTFKYLQSKGCKIEPKEVLKMGTINGAKVLKMEREIGSIEKGKKADLIFINANADNLKPMNDVFASLVLRVENENVVGVMKDGRLVFRRKNFMNKIL